jgi:hypothetical protein
LPYSVTDLTFTSSVRYLTTTARRSVVTGSAARRR